MAPSLTCPIAYAFHNTRAFRTFYSSFRLTVSTSFSLPFVFITLVYLWLLYTYCHDPATVRDPTGPSQRSYAQTQTVLLVPAPATLSAFLFSAQTLCPAYLSSLHCRFFAFLHIQCLQIQFYFFFSKHFQILSDSPLSHIVLRSCLFCPLTFCLFHPCNNEVYSYLEQLSSPSGSTAA